MSEKTCADCAHFIQHYRKEYGRYEWVNCGHCIAQRIKYRQPKAKACPDFQEGTQNP